MKYTQEMNRNYQKLLKSQTVLKKELISQNHDF